MLQFLDLFGFVSVVLRAAALSLGAITLGGVVFSALVLQKALAAPARRLLIWSAFALAATQLFYTFANSELLAATTGLKLIELAGASYFIWGCASASAALALGAFSLWRKSGVRVLQLVCSAVILAGTVATSHAAARLDHQSILIAATALHQLSMSAWIGGLPYLLLTLRGDIDLMDAGLFCKRFSGLAVISVLLLFSTGLVLSKFYVGNVSGIYGTTYGVMVVAKVVLFALILPFGGMNFRLIRKRITGDASWLKYLRRLSEPEIGIGITAILTAASLTSQPPAADLVTDRATLQTIAQRMSPKLPRMTTPPLSTLTPSARETWKREHARDSASSETYVPGQQPYSPPTEGDIAWSEYNHHWAGFIVLVMGCLAVLSRYRIFKLARYWPLAFIGLAVFLLIRADPENWPLGQSGFWESFTAADVTQHRLFVILIVLFAVFQWGVETGRLTSQKAALVFPAICCVGGALLLTHTHAISNVREELLAELSHIPLALLAVTAGWARWLEIRLPSPRARVTAQVWPVCFVLIGVVLMLYREA